MGRAVLGPSAAVCIGNSLRSLAARRRKALLLQVSMRLGSILAQFVDAALIDGDAVEMALLPAALLSISACASWGISVEG